MSRAPRAKLVDRERRVFCVRGDLLQEVGGCFPRGGKVRIERHAEMLLRQRHQSGLVRTRFAHQVNREFATAKWSTPDSAVERESEVCGPEFEELERSSYGLDKFEAARGRG
jgi:hypothetical protein